MCNLRIFRKECVNSSNAWGIMTGLWVIKKSEQLELQNNSWRHIIQFCSGVWYPIIVPPANLVVFQSQGVVLFPTPCADQHPLKLDYTTFVRYTINSTYVSIVSNKFHSIDYADKKSWSMNVILGTINIPAVRGYSCLSCHWQHVSVLSMEKIHYHLTHART